MTEFFYKYKDFKSQNTILLHIYKVLTRSDNVVTLLVDGSEICLIRNENMMYTCVGEEEPFAYEDTESAIYAYIKDMRCKLSRLNEETSMCSKFLRIAEAELEYVLNSCEDR